MESEGLLFVPMRVDALNLSKEQTVVSPTADFSQLPYLDINPATKQQEDRNPNTAFVSEAIMSSPFQNVNLTLAKGVHLHWSLPDTLTNTGEGTEFPGVPNRWLVTRKNLNSKTTEATWVVESDTFLPETTPLIPGYTNMPLPYQANRIGKPYRYMGKTYELTKWKAAPKPSQSWEHSWGKPLTTVGYGHPLFASFYPNCMGVFGAWDLPQNITGKGIQYEVIGWYENTENDILTKHNIAFANKAWQIHQQPIAQHFLDRGHLVWDQLFNNGLATATKAAVHIPDEAIGNDEMRHFLNPSPVRKLIFKEQLNQAGFIKKAAEQFHLDLVEIWPTLFNKKTPENAWLTKLNASVATVNSDFVTNTKNELKGRGKFWEDILRKMFMTVDYEEMVTKGPDKPTVSKYWKTLLKNNFLNEIDTGKAFVSDIVRKNTKFLRDIPNKDVLAVVKELTTKLTTIMSRNSIEKAFPTIFQDLLWKNLNKYELIETEIIKDGISQGAIIELDRLDKWKTLAPCYQDAISELKILFNVSSNGNLLSQDRIANRYGANEMSQIWKALTDQGWITPISGHPKLAIITKLMADAPAKHMDKLTTALNGLDVKILKVLKSDLQDYFLFHGHEKNGIITKVDFDNRFGANTSGDWKLLIENGWIHTIECEPTKKLTDYKSPGKGITQNSDLDIFCRDLYKKESPLTRATVLAKFKSDDFWAAYFEKGWLIYDLGLIVPKESRNTLDKKFTPQLAQINELIVDQIQKQTFIDRFGKEQGTNIWTALITNKIISPLKKKSKKAPIPVLIDRTLFQKNADLKEKETEILEVLNPVVNRQFILDHFQENGAEIWDDLLKKSWLEGKVSPSGELSTNQLGDLPQFPPEQEELALRGLELSIKKDTIKSIEKDLNWTIGIALDRTKCSVEITSKLWVELAAKGWIGEIVQGSDEALLEPEDNRKPLDVQFYHFLPAIRVWMNEAILSTALPTGMCCFGKVTLSPTSDSANKALQNKEAEITIGNTSTEALSCFLAHKIDETKADKIEDQLEAIQLERKMNGQQLDLATKFKELRHEKEFRAQDGGRIWQVVLENEKDGDQKTESAEQVDLSISLAHKLNALNKAQLQYERSQAEIADLKKQLFTDWYKYQLCVYPPAHAADDYPNINEVKTFIERFDLAPLAAQKKLTGDLEILKKGEKIAGAKALDAGGRDITEGSTYAAQIAQQVKILLFDLATKNTMAEDLGKKTFYTLKRIPGPRFWEPTDPALLIEGQLMKSNLRHGKDGRLRADNRLQCYTNPTLVASFEKGSFETKYIEAFIDKLEKVHQANSADDSIAFNTISTQPWNTLTLEWEVDFKAVNDPAGDGTNEKLGYDPKFIVNQFKLPADQPEFTPNNPKARVYANSYYTHTSMLTDFVKPHFSKILKIFIENRIKKDETALKLWKAENLTDLLTNKAVATSESLTNAIKALQKLDATAFMSQNLSGFNHELLMQKQTLQLPVADPLAFTDDENTIIKGTKGQPDKQVHLADSYAEFAATVEKAVGKSNFVAPEPQNEFNPIRAGRLAINRLRLVDTYGQICDLKLNKINKPTDMVDQNEPDQVRLHPRLAQPARLNFRWLSAQTGTALDDMEMNAHPATSPILGWVVPNYLDDSILIYNQNGEQLLEMTEAGELKVPPFNKKGTVDSVLANLKKNNPHLSEFCNYLNSRPIKNDKSPDSDFMKDFMTGISSSLEHINPEYFSRHKDLALLMGRPMALVRVSVGIEHKGLPAVNQDWTIFRNDIRKAFENNPPYPVGDLATMVRETRETYGTDQVQFPIRIGDYLQLNDGLVGYWDSADIKDSKFIFPHTNAKLNSTTKSIETGSKGVHCIQRTMSDGNKSMMLLFDPTAKLHATAGRLPTKTIDIPENQYLAAVRKIKVNFLAAPILTERGKLQIPVPKETGLKWSWEGYVGDEWVESPYINRNTFSNEWQRILWKNNALDLWQFLADDVKVIIPTKDETKCTIQQQTGAMYDLISKDKIWGDSRTEVNAFIGQLATIAKDEKITLTQFVNLWRASLKKNKPAKQLNLGKILLDYLLDPSVKWLKPYNDNTIIPVPSKGRALKKLPKKWDDETDFIQEIMKGADGNSPVPAFTAQQFLNKFVNRKRMALSNELWQDLIQLDWLTGEGSINKHIAISEDQIKAFSNSSSIDSIVDIEAYKSDLAELLGNYGKRIEPIRQETGFHGQQEIRDGWLSLNSPKKYALPDRFSNEIQGHAQLVNIAFDANGIVDVNDLMKTEKVTYTNTDSLKFTHSKYVLGNPFHYFADFDLKNGVNQIYAETKKLSPLNTKALTIDFWVRDLNDDTEYVMSTAFFTKAKPQYFLGIKLPNFKTKYSFNTRFFQYTGKYKEQQEFETNSVATYTNQFEPSDWNHYTLVVSKYQNKGQQNVVVYLNGKFVGSAELFEIGFHSLIEQFAFEFGAQYKDGVHGFTGCLSRFRIWSTALTPEEIKQVHQNDMNQ